VFTGDSDEGSENENTKELLSDTGIKLDIGIKVTLVIAL
jgi:hypothetical protein